MLENLPKVPRAADSKFRIGARFSTVPSKSKHYVRLQAAGRIFLEEMIVAKELSPAAEAGIVDKL